MKKVRKYITATVVMIAVLTLLTACGNKWEKHYELGTKYLNDGNYQEAVVEFTAAIELDAKKLDAYEQRANTYLLLAEMDKTARAEFTELAREELKQNVEADFSQAIELGTEKEDTFLRLAEFYQEKGDLDASLEILETGYERTQSDAIKELMEQVREQEQIRETLQNSKVGDTVKFGSYDDKEMEWLVLEANNNERLLFEKHYLFSRAYCTEEEIAEAEKNGKLLVAWKDCELRRWLNSKFYNDSFNSTGKSFITKSKINNHDAPYYEKDTKDKVYILSNHEYYSYLDLFESLYGPHGAVVGREGEGDTLDSILEHKGEMKLRLDYADDVGVWTSHVDHYGMPIARAYSQNEYFQIRPVIRVKF